MKKLAFVFIAALMALTACGGAHAAPLTFEFKASDGTLFSVEFATSIEKMTNGVKVCKQDMTSAGAISCVGYADQGGGTWSNILNMPGFANYFFPSGTPNRYMGYRTARDISCPTAYTTFAYGNGAVETLSDGCAVWQAIKAVSN